MNKKLLNKYSNKNFSQKINRKSSYLNHLSNQNVQSLKSLNVKKEGILFDEIIDNKFERNYCLFNPKSKKTVNVNSEEAKKINYNKNISKKIPLLLPYIKIVMTSENEKEFPEKYQKKNFMIDNFAGIYLKPKPKSLHKIKQIKIENNSYKQNFKSNKKINSSEFCLPLLNKNHFINSEIKNNHPYFINYNISS